MGLQLLGVFAVVSLLATYGKTQAQGSRLLIRNVRILDLDAAKVLDASDIVVQGERIVAITAPGAEVAAEGDQSVDGAGAFVIPGLVDSHAHFADPQNYAELCLVHGVTLVRDLGGETGQVVKLREELRSGTVLGPELLITGAIVDGRPPIWPFSKSCVSPEEGSDAVAELVEAGVDMIKVYSMLRPEVHAAVVAAAHDQGLLAVGHVPVAMTLEEAIAQGQDEIEHLTGFGDAIGRLLGMPRVTNYIDDFARLAEYEKLEPGRIEPLARSLKEHGVVQCPTLVVYAGIGLVDDPKVGSLPQMQYVAPYIRSFWNADRYRFSEGARRAVGAMQKIIHDLHRYGVTLICGTDLANPYVFAGDSLHEEMRLFAEAGIPAVEVLKSATSIPCRHFGVDDRLGKVAAQKTASFVLLERNPLEDIINTRSIRAVVRRGRCFGREELDALQDGVKARVQAIAVSDSGR